MRRAHFSHCNALALFTCKFSDRTQSTPAQAPTPPQHQHSIATSPHQRTATAAENRSPRPLLHTTSARAPNHYNTTLRQRTFAQHQGARPQQDHSTGRATQQHTASTPKRNRQATPHHRQMALHIFGASAADRHMHRNSKK